MNRGLLIAIVSVAILLLAIIGSYISFYNTAVKLENTTRAQFQSNKNAYDSMWKTIQEVAQVPQQYKDDFKDLLVTETTAKYGDKGSQATFQWFKDRDLKLPPEMYTKVQTAIEANRAEFRRGQDVLLDKQRRYSDHIQSFGGSIWAGMSGHPKPVMGELAPTKDLDGDGVMTVLDYPIVTSAKTEAAFATGEDNEPVNVFGK